MHAGRIFMGIYAITNRTHVIEANRTAGRWEGGVWVRNLLQTVQTPLCASNLCGWLLWCGPTDPTWVIVRERGKRKRQHIFSGTHSSPALTPRLTHSPHSLITSPSERSAAFPHAVLGVKAKTSAIGWSSHGGGGGHPPWPVLALLPLRL